MRAIARVLADDGLQGCKTGTKGAEIAADYLGGECRLLGLRHSLLLLFPTGEELGLVGLDWFLAHPLWPLDRPRGGQPRRERAGWARLALRP
jgi:hypothetical protein